MDKDKFKQVVQQYAVIKERTPPRHSRERSKKETVIEIDEFGDEVEVERTVVLENNTLPFDLVKVKNSAKSCEIGCGRILDDQVLSYHLNQFPYTHWRTKCVNCGKHLGPDGTTLYENGVKAQAAFYSAFLKKK